MQQKRYDEYKDSKIEWIGKVPKNWQIKKIKQIAKYEIGGTPSREKDEYFEGDNLWVSISDLNNNKIIQDTYEKITEEGIKNSNCKLIPQGSLLFSFKLTIGLMAFAGRDLYTNEAIASFLTSSKVNLKYLYYVLQTEFENNARENIYGAKLFNQRTINDAKIQFPSYPEQEEIEKFLEKKTFEIEKVIKNKKNQIRLLEEYEQIILQTAVTRGLNSNNLHFKRDKFPFKVPYNWEVKTFRRICDVNQGLQIDREKRFDEIAPNRYPYITIKFLNSGEAPNEFIENPPKSVICNEKDILLARTGATGEVITGVSGVFHNNFFRINQNEDKIIKRFLVYYLKEDWIKKMLLLKAGVTTIPDLNHRAFLDSPVPIPPIIEQQQIADYLDEKTSKIRKSIELIEMEVEKLEEYKRILINDTVTGKIKVF